MITETFPPSYVPYSPYNGAGIWNNAGPNIQPKRFGIYSYSFGMGGQVVYIDDWQLIIDDNVLDRHNFENDTIDMPILGWTVFLGNAGTDFSINANSEFNHTPVFLGSELGQEVQNIKSEFYFKGNSVLNTGNFDFAAYDGNDYFSLVCFDTAGIIRSPLAPSFPEDSGLRWNENEWNRVQYTYNIADRNFNIYLNDTLMISNLMDNLHHIPYNSPDGTGRWSGSLPQRFGLAYNSYSLKSIPSGQTQYIDDWMVMLDTAVLSRHNFENQNNGEPVSGWAFYKGLPGTDAIYRIKEFENHTPVTEEDLNNINNTKPLVTNISAVQGEDGIITITYDLQDNEQDQCNVEFYYWDRSPFEGWFLWDTSNSNWVIGDWGMIYDDWGGSYFGWINRDWNDLSWVKCKSVENSGSQRTGPGKKAYWKVKNDLNGMSWSAYKWGFDDISPNLIKVAANDGQLLNYEFEDENKKWNPVPVFDWSWGSLDGINWKWFWTGKTEWMSGFDYDFVIDTENPLNNGCKAPANGVLVNGTINPVLEALPADDMSHVRYNFIIDDNPEFDNRNNEQQKSGWTGTSWNVEKPLYKKAYWWKVQCKDVYNNKSEDSNPFSFTIDDTPPQNVGCSLPENGKTIAKLWTTLEALQAYDDSLPLSYNFIIDDNPEFDNRNGRQETSGWLTERRWKAENLLYEKTYWWKVRCKDSCNNEISSAPFSFSVRYVFFVDVYNTTGIENGSIQNPFNSIGEAVQAASGEALIKAAKGTYYESVYVAFDKIKFFGGYDPVTWRRDIKANKTVIDGQGNCGFKFYSSYNNIITNNTIIDGFTIRNCDKGIENVNSMWWYDAYTGPVIRNNIIENNNTGIYYNAVTGEDEKRGDMSIIENNIVRNNAAYGIKAGNRAVLRKNVIVNNGTYGVYGADLVEGNIISDNGSLNENYDYHKGGVSNASLIKNNFIYGNKVSGVCNSSNIINNNIFENKVGIYQSGEARNNIIFNNEIGLMGSWYPNYGIIYSSSSYNIIWNNSYIDEYNYNKKVSADFVNLYPGTGDISCDPLWTNDSIPFDIAGETYFIGGHVVPASPVIDAGDPDDAYFNEPLPNGSRVNIGVYGNTPGAETSYPLYAAFANIPRQMSPESVNFKIKVGIPGDTVCKLRVEYSFDSSGFYPAVLSKDLLEVSADNIDNSSFYQVKNIKVKGGSGYADLIWDIKSDVPSGFNGTVYLRIKAMDSSGRESGYAVSTVVIDKTAPVQPGNLTVAGVTVNSVTLNFGSPAQDANFAGYKVYYDTVYPVTEKSRQWFRDSRNILNDRNYAGETAFTIDGLCADTQYYFNIWVYDALGNKSYASQEALARTLPIQSQPNIIIVPDDYPTIQSAVHSAQSGDIIQVKNGVYDEVIMDIPSGLAVDAETVLEAYPGHKPHIKQIVFNNNLSYVRIKGFVFDVGQIGQSSNDYNDYSAGRIAGSGVWDVPAREIRNIIIEENEFIDDAVFWSSFSQLKEKGLNYSLTIRKNIIGGYVIIGPSGGNLMKEFIIEGNEIRNGVIFILGYGMFEGKIVKNKIYGNRYLTPVIYQEYDNNAANILIEENVFNNCEFGAIENVSSLLIRNNVFNNCGYRYSDWPDYWGAINGVNNSLIENNIFSDCVYGIVSGSSKILNNTFYNTRTAVYRTGKNTIKNNIFSNCSNGAVDTDTFYNTLETVERNLYNVTYNNAYQCGQYPYSTRGIRLAAGIGNIESDPKFVNPASSNFHLRPESPCIDTGDPGILDADSTRSDMGAFGGENFPLNKEPPSEITELTACDLELSGKIKLDWSGYDESASGGGKSDIAYYHIYQTTSDFADIYGIPSVKTVYAGTKENIIEGLTNGKLYYFAVTALDSTGNENFGVTAVSVIPTDKVAPEQITSLVVHDPGLSGILNLSWSGYDTSGSKDLAGYSVYMNENPFENVSDLTPLISTDKTESGRQISGLINNQPYYFAVTAYDSLNNENKSVQSVCGIPTDKVPPAAVTLLSAKDTKYGGEILLNWSEYSSFAPDDLYGFRIYQSTASFTNVNGLKPVASLDKLLNKYYVRNLTINTSYYFAVTAIDDSGNENKEVHCVHVIPAGDSIPPAQVAALAVQNKGTGNTVTLDWSGYDEAGQGDVAWYKVYQSDSVFSEVNSLNPAVFVKSGTFKKDVENLVDGKLYYFAVTAIDNRGNEDKTVQAVSGMSLDVVPPAEVSDFTAKSGDGIVKLSWQNPDDSDFSGIRLLRATDNDSRFTIYEGMSTLFSDTAVTNGGTYTYIIRTFDEVPNYSQGISAGVKTDKPQFSMLEGTGIDNTGYGMYSLFFDFDGDGYEDIFLVNGGLNNDRTILYHNNGDLTFSDSTEAAGMSVYGFGSSAEAGDIDNDGDNDIYITFRGNRNRLFRNDGGIFSDITDYSRTGDSGDSRHAVFADIDNDGDLDIYLSVWGNQNVIYINSGNGVFNKADGEEWDALKDPVYSRKAIFFDYDNDGDRDVFIANYNRNTFLINDGLRWLKAATPLDTVDDDSYDIAAGDIDNDGFMEVYVANKGRDYLYKYDSISILKEINGPWSDKNDTTYSVKIEDFDHNGFKDIITGTSQGVIIYKNNGNLQFSEDIPDSPSGNANNIRNVHLADIDNDGDLDLYAVSYGKPNILYVNNQNDNNWLKINLTGTSSNSNGIGARIKVIGSLFYKEVTSPGPWHFGLPEDITYLAEINFPSGTNVSLNNVIKGRILKISEPDEIAPAQITVLTAKDTKLSGRINLNWSGYKESKDFNRYNIYYKDYNFNNVSNTTPAFNINAGVHEWTIDNLVNGTAYYFAVTGVDKNANENKDVLAVSCIPTEDLIPPLPVTGLFAANPGDGNCLNLSWNTLEIVHKFRIYQADTFFNNVSTLSPVAELDGADLEYKAESLIDGKLYYFAVATVDEIGNENKTVSAVSAVSTDTKAPHSVYNLLSVSENNLVKLIWTNLFDNDFAGIKLTRITDNDSSSAADKLTIYEGLTNYYTDTTVTNGITYIYSIQAYDEVPNYSESVRVRALPLKKQFEDVTNQSNLHSSAYGRFATFSDIDNDGDEDLYIVHAYDKNILYRNEGNGTFSDITVASGTGDVSQGYAAVFFDYDNDGFLDLFTAASGAECILFKNNGKDKVWTKITGPWQGKNISAKSAAVSDFDHNGYLDLFVGRYGANILYLNSGLGWIEAGGPWKEIADDTQEVKIADINGDGDSDIFVVNSGSSNLFYENQGNGTFANKTRDAGLISLSSCQSAEFADLDNDSDLDLILNYKNGTSVFYENNGHGQFTVLSDTGVEITGGLSRDIKAFSFRNNIFNDVLISREGGQNKYFQNAGIGKFIDITHQANLDKSLYTQKSAVSDIDNDGDLDIYLSNFYNYGVLYENRQNDNNYLKVKLRGLNTNTDGYGAKIELYDSGYLNIKEYLKGSREVHSRITHFGLEGMEKTDLKVKFPGGWTEVVRRDVLPGQLLEIFEPYITELNSIQGNGFAKLKWINPDERDFLTVKIVRNEFEYPKNSGDGIVVYEGVDTAYTDINLTNERKYFYAVFLTDAEGRISPVLESAKTHAIPDGIPPWINISNVSDKRYYNYPVRPLINVFDINLDTAIIELNGQSYTGGRLISDEGIYNLEVKARDIAFNSSEVFISFIIDTTSPVVAISGVRDSNYYSTDVSPQIEINDSYLETTVITLNGENYSTGTVISGEGEYILSVSARDKAGNSRKTDAQFVIEKTPPVITISDVFDGKHYNTDRSPVISFDERYLDTTKITLNGMDYTSGTPITMENNYILSAWARDMAMNEASKTVLFTIDKTKPAPPVFDSPISPTNISKLNIRGYAEPGSLVTLYCDGRLFGIGTASVDSSFVFSSLDISEGNNSFNATAEDKSGNISLYSAPLNIVLDTIPPPVPVLIYPQNGAVVYTRFPAITGTAEPDSLVSLKIINTIYTAQADQNGQWTFSDVVLSEGENIFTLWTTDKAGNRGPDLIPFPMVMVKLVDLEVEKKILENNPRLLAWVNDDDGLQFIHTILQGEDVFYNAVKDLGEFKKQFRSGKYNIILLLNDKKTPSARFMKEIEELVNSGTGLIVSGSKISKFPHLKDVLGIKFKGYLPARDNLVNLMESPISHEGVFQSIGKCQKVKLETGQMAGYVSVIPDMPHNGKITAVDLEAGYDFIEGKNYTLTFQVYEGNRVRSNKLLDEEIFSFDTLSSEGIDNNQGVKNTNLLVKGAGEKVEFLIENTKEDGRLNGDYTVQVIIYEDNNIITIGPAVFEVEKCVSPVNGEKHSGFTITNVEREGKCCVEHPEPVIVLNSYGEGKAVLFTFDLLKSNTQNNINKIKDMLLNSINYVSPSGFSINPMETLPIGINIQNKGKAVDLKIKEMAPAGTEISNIFNEGIKIGNEIIWQFNLSENMKKELRYYLFVPDVQADWTAITEIEYLHYDSTWQLYGSYPLNIEVAHNVEGLAEEIISALNDLALSYEDRNKAERVIEILNIMTNRYIFERSDFEKNIKDCLKAIDKLAKITGAGTTSIRLKLDELLRINEIKWSMWK
ncbi:MAG: FG-GAP-like repeat-containing protein [bacterium]